MNSQLLIGQYWPEESVVHEMDPRAKFVLTFVIMAALLCANTTLSLGVAAVFVLAFYALARIPFKQALKALTPLLFLVAFVVIFNILFIRGGYVFFEWGIFCVSEGGFIKAAFIGTRLVLLLLGVCLLTLTTTTFDITHAFEFALKPLAKVGVPVHEMGMVLGIALRFLPLFFNEFLTLQQAQESRGAQLSGGGFRGVRALSSFVIPLFSSVFRHADTLSQAMDARCYHGASGKTMLNPPHFEVRDALGCVLVVVMLALVLVVNIISIS
jgi:energy-coupling factor transport system permease protein